MSEQDGVFRAHHAGVGRLAGFTRRLIADHVHRRVGRFVQLKRQKLDLVALIFCETREQIAKLERELAAVQSRTLFVEETYGIDNLHLTVAKSFLAKILNKPAIVRWLKANQPDYLAEFQQIADLVSLNEAAPA